MAFLSQSMMSLWLGMPLWVWLAFIGVVLLLLVFALGVIHRETHEIGVKESLWMPALYIGLGLLWSVAACWIYATYDQAGAVDEQIADALAAGISRAPWISPQQVQYAVNDGEVALSGVVTSEDQRLALNALVDGIGGVRGMRDELRLTSNWAAQPG